MRLRRAVLLLIGGVAACYAVHVDETQVRAITADDMDCDESLVNLENVDSSDIHVARYVARGCGRTRTYDCEREDDGHVACRAESRGGDDSPHDPAGDVAAAGAVAAAGCACASLFASKSGGGSDDGSGGSNPSSTTPASNH